jgi:hypothetical protein
MNISPLKSIGIILGGGALVGVASKAVNDAAVSHDKKHPGGFPTGDVVLGASMVTGAAAFMTSATMRAGALGGTGTLAYALAGVAALGILGGAGFPDKG